MMHKVLMILIVASIGLTGCSPKLASDIAKGISKNDSYSESRIKDTKNEYREYLSEKYGDSFEIVSTELSGVLNNSNKVRGYYTENPTEYFEVHKDNGQLVDNYYSILREDETAQYIKGLLEPEVGDCVVLAKISQSLGKEYNRDKDLIETINELKKNKRGTRLVCNIYFTEPLNDKADKIEKIIKDEKLDGAFAVYYVNCYVSSSMSKEELTNIRTDNSKVEDKEIITIK